MALCANSFYRYSVVRKSAYNFFSVLNKSCLGQLPLRNWDLHAFLVIHVNITE